MRAATFKQVKVLQVVGQPGQHVGEVLLVELQVVWNVGHFIGDVVRELLGAQVRRGGAGGGTQVLGGETQKALP